MRATVRLNYSIRDALGSFHNNPQFHPHSDHSGSSDCRLAFPFNQRFIPTLVVDKTPPVVRSRQNVFVGYLLSPRRCCMGPFEELI